MKLFMPRINVALRGAGRNYAHISANLRGSAAPPSRDSIPCFFASASTCLLLLQVRVFEHKNIPRKLVGTSNDDRRACLSINIF